MATTSAPEQHGTTNGYKIHNHVEVLDWMSSKQTTRPECHTALTK